MTLPRAKVTVLDGGLGRSADGGDIPQAVVGVCSGGDADQVFSFNDPTNFKDVRTKLGYGPLSDAVVQMLAAGCPQVYAAKATTGTPGECGAVTDDKTGLGVVTVAGEAYDAWPVKVKIARAGGNGVAIFQYSLDNGQNWSRQLLVPAAGTYEIPNTNVTLTFDDAAGDFAKDDAFTFATTAPVATTNDLGTAIDRLTASSYHFDIVLVAQITDNTFWTSMGTKTLGLETASVPRFLQIVTMADYRGAAETTTEWVTDLVNQSLSVENYRVSVCSGWVELMCPADGFLKARNAAAIVCGWIGASRTNVSPGKVMRGGLPMVTRILPDRHDKDESDGLTDAQIADLDTSRYVTIRQHPGRTGFYVTNWRTMGAPTSDFAYGEYKRVMDKACRLVHIAAVGSIQTEATTIAAIEADCQDPLDDMMDPGTREIAAGRAWIPDGQDILGTETVQVKVRLTPTGTVRNIETEIGFENPLLAS